MRSIAARRICNYERARALRYRRPLSLIMLDIDHFKRVNDAHGHPTGDAVIKRVARCVASTVRAADHVARLGGEELAVLAPEIDSTGALALAERIRRAVAAGTEPVAVTVSLGACTWASGPLEIEELLRRADEALYRSKDAGRNRTTAVVLAA
jgi:diguanylate cyclase (GGDEF)-like protein